MNQKTKRLPRVSMPMQDAQLRRGNFSEVALGYTLEQARTEAGRCLQCKKAPCQLGCPVEVDCKQFIRHVAEGRLDEAYSVIKATNSLPAICGRKPWPGRSASPACSSRSSTTGGPGAAPRSRWAPS